MRRGDAGRGFTLIELLVVLAVVATLLSIAVPRYVDRVESAREETLRASLKVMRAAIDQFEADTGKLPATLDELVERRYLKDIPPDPITERRDGWVALPPADPGAGRLLPARTGVADVRSGAEGNGRDGTPYASW